MNLPWAGTAASLDSFVGREKELAEATAQLTSNRLLTLLGPGGAGKTRLALRLAELADLPTERRWFVELSSTSDDVCQEDVARILAVGTRFVLPGQTEPLSELALALGGESGLLVLDSCEHVSEVVAGVVGRLLARCPAVKVIVTSQRALGLPGEMLHLVQGLALPGSGTTAWQEADAVRLFVERAQEVDPDFVPVPYVVDICKRLDGMPLSIELAARWVGALNPAEILDELTDHRFDLLTSNSSRLRTHEGLRQVIERSYHMLTLQEQELLRRLSVVPGPFDIGVVVALGTLAGASRTEVLQLTRQLTMKSFVTPIRGMRPDASDQRSRFGLMESIQQFGRDRVRAAQEEEACRARLTAWYVELCEPLLDSESFLYPAKLMERLTEDLDNLTAVFAWIRTSDDHRSQLVLGIGLGAVLHRLGHYTRAAELIASLPEPKNSDITRCALLFARAWSVLDAGSVAEAALAVNDLEVAAAGMHVDMLRVHAAFFRSVLCVMEGDFAGATAYQQLGAELAHSVGNPAFAAWMDVMLAWQVVDHGDHVRASKLITPLVAALRMGSDGETLAFALITAGAVAVEAGDTARAECCFVEALGTADSTSVILKLCLEGLLRTAAAAGQHVRALRLAGAIRNLPYWTFPPQTAARWREQRAAAEASARVPLTQSAAERAFDEGGELTRQETFEYALRHTLPIRFVAGQPSPLSRREEEVVQLVSKGLTNRQIATRLTLSTRTIETHLENVRTKLNFNSRSQISAWFALREDDRSKASSVAP